MAYINDGFPTTVSFALSPTVKFKEKTITPPGMDGGGPNDTTTMRNIAKRTRQPKKLVTLTDMSMTASYDPECYTSIITNLINKNGLVTVTFPDGATLVFYGYLDKFMPGELREGEQPTASITVVPTNQDNSGVEVDAVYTAGP